MINISAGNPTIGVVGLGYVGLPLAVEFGKRYATVGFDLSADKIAAYRDCFDPSGELSADELRAATQLEFTTDPRRLSGADFLIVAVPTPVDKGHVPDLSMLTEASATVGQNMKAGVTVIYESTVYPGATEEVCVPILESESGLQWKKGFHVGYSPERVNPGDKERTIKKIVKVVSGDDDATLRVVGDLYESVITAGVHRASSIKVAEAAKVIENTQRDLNIALINELAIMFEKIGIDTLEVLKAAGTKWNFLPFRPGLVGGHCIGVDPYYLTHKAEMLGYHPQVILAGRRINDGMAAWVAQQIVKQMIHAGGLIKGAKVNVLGLTFKENCLDLRNSKVADLVNELRDYGCDVLVHDPIASAADSQQQYGIALEHWETLPKADALVVAVAHQHYLDMPIKILQTKLKSGGLFVDLKSTYPQEDLIDGGFRVWRL
ncbi:MAG: nucleotide sugar dehydrogenase [Burkholderiales bacterium]|nr:nucleotide sugar dehydrogenase [Burkholderiales bacterium]